MHLSIVSAAVALALASPSLAQSGRGWTTPSAGQTGTVTDPSRIYCIIDDGHLADSPDCTIFTSNGAGGLQAAGSDGWLQVNEQSHLIEIATPGDTAPAFRWQGSHPLGARSTESLSYFSGTGTDDNEEPLYGPIWNHVPGEDYVAVFTGSGQEAPVVLSFVPN
ncbi:hypothetical protein BDW59DRAFT_157590 [Aspergillus cavernicola]|uniref:Secreted protein n=1 Tax=Aspergillus cavernicola TaxID=176166 RepID=A0ABR4IWI2_9EURO